MILRNSTFCFDDEYFLSLPFISLCICLVSINVVVIIGNILVIILVKSFWRLRNSIANIFIINLAASDLFLGLFVLPLSLVNELLKKHWIFGNELCGSWLAIDVCLSTASILNLVIVGLDRFIAICHSIRYPSLMNHGRARILVSFVWISAFIICAPTIFTVISTDSFSVVMNHSEFIYSIYIKRGCYNIINYSCSIENSSQIYKIYSALGSFFIPLIILVYFYVRIFSTVRENAKKFRIGALSTDRKGQPAMRIHLGTGYRKNSKVFEKLPLTSSDDRWRYAFLQDKPSKNNTQPTTPVRSDVSISIETIGMRSTRIMSAITEIVEQPGGEDFKKPDQIFIDQKILISKQKRAQTKHNKYAKETKAARLLAIVCGAFIICWAPFFTLYFLGAFISLNEQTILFDIFFWLGYTNSALNPIIYFIVSRDFRIAFKKIFMKRG